ncbi:MAG: tannase/feruloyl esterase family alpha/beta hydrolase [Dinoroseobacter sp.]|nr:tannase/feruloyl esterase family alpha/beta hydrolase [Dinoroseobacter sp.]
MSFTRFSYSLGKPTLCMVTPLMVTFGPAFAADCSIDAFPSLPDVRMVSVTSEAAPVQHCKVAGVLGTETNFELLLPDDWNGKFVMGGGGGFVGSVINAASDFVNALELGWATVGTDTGHQGHSLDASWAYNNLERLVSFGHQAVHRTAVVSKPLIEAHYGQEISRSIFFGCSRGGGQALMEAQRHPEDFDGIVAMAPAFNWTHELGARWIIRAQTMYPDPEQLADPVIGAEAQALIGKAIMTECDGLDGLADGILNDPRQCSFDVATLACTEQSSNECLSADQVAAAKAIHDTFKIDGQTLHGTPVGAELPGSPLGWTLWTTGGYNPDAGLKYHEGSDTGEFQPPPAPNGSWAFANGILRYFIQNDPDWSYVGYDFSDFAAKAARVAPTLNADDPDLSEFRARGGKLIIDNGWMDGSMSAYGTLNYCERILALDPTASEDVRLFLRPGIAHCNGGPGPDGTNYLIAMDKWLDTGVAPDSLPAPFRGKDGGRIVCAHPGVVTYDGSGNPNSPESFSCSLPN